MSLLKIKIVSVDTIQQNSTNNKHVSNMINENFIFGFLNKTEKINKPKLKEFLKIINNTEKTIISDLKLNSLFLEIDINKIKFLKKILLLYFEFINNIRIINIDIINKKIIKLTNHSNIYSINEDNFYLKESFIFNNILNNLNSVMNIYDKNIFFFKINQLKYTFDKSINENKNILNYESVDNPIYNNIMKIKIENINNNYINCKNNNFTTFYFIERIPIILLNNIDITNFHNYIKYNLKFKKNILNELYQLLIQGFNCFFYYNFNGIFHNDLKYFIDNILVKKNEQINKLEYKNLFPDEIYINITVKNPTVLFKLIDYTDSVNIDETHFFPIDFYTFIISIIGEYKDNNENNIYYNFIKLINKLYNICTLFLEKKIYFENNINLNQEHRLKIDKYYEQFKISINYYNKLNDFHTNIIQTIYQYINDDINLSEFKK
jgi:hypothetical protein